MKQGSVALIVGNPWGIGELLKIKLEEVAVTVLVMSEPNELPNTEEWKKHLDDLVGSIKRIDYVVGLADNFRISPFLETEEADWDRMVFLNVKAPFLLSRKVLPIMIKQDCGSFVFLSSSASRTGMAGAATYAATKGGLHGFVRSLALEAAPSNVRVNIVSIADSQDVVDPKAIAEVIIFLLAEESSFITGQEIMTGKEGLW